MAYIKMQIAFDRAANDLDIDQKQGYAMVCLCD